MNGNPGHGGAGRSIEWVREQLQALSAIKPPGSLRGRLIAGIPPAPVGMPLVRRIRPWSRIIHWGTAAAALLLVGSAVVAWLGAPWGRQARPAADANSILGRAYACDYNSLHLSDTNLCDTNSPR